MSTVTIRYHQEAEGWWAEAEAIPGWTGVGSTFAEARQQALSAVHEFLGGNQDIQEDGAPPDVGLAGQA